LPGCAAESEEESMPKHDKAVERLRALRLAPRLPPVIGG
jgi:hypothetical protein